MKLSAEQKAALKKFSEGLSHEGESLNALEKTLITVEALRDIYGERWIIVADTNGFNVKKS